jgi:hypothetical protein
MIELFMIKYITFKWFNLALDKNHKIIYFDQIR